MKTIKIIFIAIISMSLKLVSQTSQTLSSETPLHFTSIGDGTYNRTVFYNQINGLSLELAKVNDNNNSNPINFNINTRGGTHPFLSIKGVNGNVGIGTANPQYLIDIVSSVDNYKQFRVKSPGSPLIKLSGSYNSGNGAELYQNPSGDLRLNINSAKNGFLIKSNGNFGIGTANPDMKLTVKGNIHAEEVKIDLNVPAPDYVFKSNYKLRSIEEVESFIKKYSHLPEIPSAKEFAKNGVMQAKMDMSLLKKIEELTLYTIEQEKKLKKQEKKINALEKQNTQIYAQKKEIEELRILVNKLLKNKN